MQDQAAGDTEAPLFQYYFRALICFAAAGTIASQLNWSAVGFLHASILIFLLAYIYIAYLITRKIPEGKRALTGRWLSYTDAALIGVVLTFVNFSLLPTILFTTMIQFNALQNGGRDKWLGDNLALVAGMALGLFFHQPKWVFTTSLEISAASIIGISTYFCASAAFTYQKIARLQQEARGLQKEQNLYKLRAYKLSRYLPTAVWEAVNQGKEQTLNAERKRMTIFFSDIKDFSQLSEELEAETLTELLNTYLTEMSKIVAQYGGTIDKFMGDGMMVLFGDRASKGVKSDALRCLSMALAMRKRMKVLQRHWYNQGIKKPLQIRMGINTGYCTIGTFGTSHHLDYTVLGTHVNLASRLESVAEPGHILISHETWSLVKDVVMCRDKGEVSVKGFSHPIKVYHVVDLRKELGSDQSYYEHNIEGFSLHMDLDRVRNYDKDKVLHALEQVSEALKDKIIV